MDMHVVVDGNISVQEGHMIGHAVKDRLSEGPVQVTDVIVHIEPDNYL